jgi:type II secretory ATPase GspE/PulE/Tfp pilus assembly ATPase PilB-like protein
MDQSKLTIGRLAGCLLGLGLLEASMAMAGPLGQVPAPGSYVSYLRIILILLAVLPWLAFCQFVDKDTVYVRRMNREAWNGIVLGGGIVGLAVWLLLPWNTPGLFAAGFGLWFLITVSTCAVYVVIRNSHVDVGSRVFTPRHLKAKLAGLGKKKEDKMDAVERVRLTDHAGKKITVPTDPTQTDPYEAAQTLLFDALWRRATDVAMAVTPSAVRLVYMVDGVATPRHDLLPRDAAEQALNFIKQVSGLDVNERRKPQRGEMSGAITGTNASLTEFEVRTSGSTQGEQLALKIVGEENRLRISDLGMLEPQQKQFEELAAKAGGLVLIAGPRVSGVTTTLYAALRSHDAFMQNLLTLERVPLMELENITQNIYDATKTDVPYARQLQTILRREPDVVMVSDCLDRETAHLAVKGAQEGKKIYLGVQAKDSFDALKKLVSLAGDTDGVANVLLAVTCQRLVRKLCIACRQAYRPDPQLLKKANLPIDKIEHFYRPPPEGLVDQKGNPIICTNCQGSGYFGRTGVFEILSIDDPMRELIRNGQPINMLKAQARTNRMLYLQEVGLQKVIAGITSMNEVLRVLRDEEAGSGPSASGARLPRSPSPAPAPNPSPQPA